MNSETQSQAAALTPVSELLDRVYRQLRGHGAGLLAVAAVPAAATILAYGVTFALLRPWNSAPHAPSLTPAMALYFGLVWLGMTIVWVVSEAAVVQAALGAGPDDRPRVGAIYAKVLRRLGPLLWLAILRILLVLAPVLVCLPLFGLGALAWVYFFGSAFGQLGWFLLVPALLLLYLGWFAYLVYISLRVSLAVPAALEENLGAREALRRSGVLTRAVKGRIFLIVLVVYAVSYACFLVFCVLAIVLASLGVLAFTLSGIHLAPLLAAAAVTLLVLLGGLLVAFCMASAWTIFGVTFAVIFRDRQRQCAPPAEPPALA